MTNDGDDALPCGHAKDNLDAGGHCNALVLDDDGYGDVCGYVTTSRHSHDMTRDDARVVTVSRTGELLRNSGVGEVSVSLTYSNHTSTIHLDRDEALALYRRLAEHLIARQRNDWK